MTAERAHGVRNTGDEYTTRDERLRNLVERLKNLVLGELLQNVRGGYRAEASGLPAGKGAVAPVGGGHYGTVRAACVVRCIGLVQSVSA